MSDPVEIELVDIDSITSSGAKFWGRVKVVNELEVVAENHTAQSSDSTLWTHSYNNPTDGNLILITTHTRGY